MPAAPLLCHQRAAHGVKQTGKKFSAQTAARPAASPVRKRKERGGAALTPSAPARELPTRRDPLGPSKQLICRPYEARSLKHPSREADRISGPYAARHKRP